MTTLVVVIKSDVGKKIDDDITKSTWKRDKQLQPLRGLSLLLKSLNL